MTHPSAADKLLRWIGHRAWLPWSLRMRVVRFFRHPDRTPPTPFTVGFFGALYPGRLNTLIDSHVYFFGAYSEQELRLLQRLLALRGPAAVFVDVGANVGHHTLYMARHAAQVHSFEPWPLVADRIREKLELNRIPNVTLHPFGLGTEDATLDFYAAASGNTGTGSFSAEHAAGRNRPVGKMNIAAGDAYFQRAGIDRIDLLKIDVEGWEPYVIQGLRQTIHRTRPIIFMEYSDTTSKALPEGLKTLLSWMPGDYEPLYAVIGGREFKLLPSPPSGIETELVLLPKADRDALRLSAFS